MATIQGDGNFTEEEETNIATEIKEAMDGCGTNEGKIIEILIKHNNFQRRRIAKAYAQAFGKPLDEDLKDELSGDFEECICSLIREPRELDAVMIHDAISGIGTDERMLIGIFVTRSNAEIDEIKEHYKRLYDVEMIEDLKADTSGYFCRMLYSLCTGFRQVEECDDDYASEQAQKLIDAGIGQFGTDECDFNQVLCLNSKESLNKIFDKYREQRGNELEKDIDDEMSGDVREGYKAMIKLARDKNDFFAERLYNDTTGCWGTNDSELIRTLISRSEIDLEDIKEAFLNKYGTSLYETVASECSGHYKKALLAIISGHYEQEQE